MRKLGASFIGRREIMILLTALVAGTDAGAQEIPPALKARVWDVPITIPAGGYRATNPVDLSGDIDIRLEPGAWLDGMEFHWKDSTQHWNIEGSFLKKVQIPVPVGGSLVAKNSVFEDCLFYKESPNYAPLWSSRWTFENCVLTRGFTRPSVNMADYSIVARSSTFIGIDFPQLGLKERMDPASYLQKENFGFDRCRFIHCKITATVLAATKDCVFEQCTFLPMRGSWPSETTEIKVTAYWDSAGTPTKPSVKKPIVLEYEKLPEDFGPVGSTLEFTQSGGYVTAKEIPKPTRLETIGALKDTARELSAE